MRGSLSNLEQRLEQRSDECSALKRERSEAQSALFLLQNKLRDTEIRIEQVRTKTCGVGGWVRVGGSECGWVRVGLEGVGGIFV
jgi:hypothetical protein